jgi:hypothetical protein
MRAAGNKEGVEFLEHVKNVFAESFEAKQGGRVLYREARDAVSTSMSAVNENLFQRHAARLIKEQWPQMVPSRNDCERCYLHIAMKEDD